MLKLKLPVYEYLLKRSGDRINIFDPVRKKYIKLTPEEWVRQHFLNWLIEYKNVPIPLINVEGGTKYNQLAKRTDILVYSRKGTPLLLVENKAPNVSIDKEVVFQISTYYQSLKTQYLAISNGLISYYWKRVNAGFIELTDLPEYNEMQ